MIWLTIYWNLTGFFFFRSGQKHWHLACVSFVFYLNLFLEMRTISVWTLWNGVSIWTWIAFRFACFLFTTLDLLPNCWSTVPHKTDKIARLTSWMWKKFKNTTQIVLQHSTHGTRININNTKSASLYNFYFVWIYLKKHLKNRQTFTNHYTPHQYVVHLPSCAFKSNARLYSSRS